MRMEDSPCIRQIQDDMRQMSLDIKGIQMQLTERCSARMHTISRSKEDIDTLFSKVNTLDRNMMSLDHIGKSLASLSKTTEAQGDKLQRLDKTLAKWSIIMLLIQTTLTAGIVKVFMTIPGLSQ